MIHALSVDVEDYNNVIPREWLNRPGPPTAQVVVNTRRYLELFAERQAHATFFVLGEVAEHFPELIVEIAQSGHELGVHGYYHRQVFKLTPDEFRKEVATAKAVIEDVSGCPVRGHRAPAFSIMPKTEWALEVLAEEGFAYDSSVFPIQGRRYGWPGFSRDIQTMTLASGRCITEVPMSTMELLGKRIPVAGGGYLRHFPWAFNAWAMERIAHERPVIVYLHPYEIEVTRAPLAWEHLAPADRRRTKRFHYLQLRNRHTMESKIRRMLDRFEFTTIARVIAETLEQSAQADDER